ncbi:unnamed protein product [Lepidochelys kempii]
MLQISPGCFPLVQRPAFPSFVCYQLKGKHWVKATAGVNQCNATDFNWPWSPARSLLFFTYKSSSVSSQSLYRSAACFSVLQPDTRRAGQRLLLAPCSRKPRTTVAAFNRERTEEALSKNLNCLLASSSQK